MDGEGHERRQRPRRADDLVGWRLGQLELELQKVEENVVRLRDDLIKRTGRERDQANQRDWVVRVLVAIIAAGQLVTAVVLVAR